MSYIGQGLEQAYSERFIFTASGGETSVSSADDGRTLIYTIGQVDVYKNGLKLVNGVDFVANTGTSITSLATLTAGDVLEIVAQSVVAAPDAVSASAGGTFEASIAVQGNISFTGNITGDGSDLTDVRAETVEVNVKNVSGGSLAKGTPVHQTGTSGSSTFEVVAANASSASTMPAHFVLLETLADQAEGRGLLMGRISGIDTSSFSEGDTIYVAAGGGFTNSPPTGEGNLIQNLGTVTKVHASNGGGEVMGAGRSAATPNLNDGNIFLGNASNQATTASLSTSVSNLSHYNNTNWDTAYGWGNHASVGYLTGNQTITLTGDVSGSGTTSIAVTIADDSHNHVISNVDGLQTALNAKQDASTALTTSTIRFRSANGTTQPLSASYTFSNVFTAEDSSTRVAYFDGNGGNASVWWGNGANAHAALDSSDGAMNIWVNPSNGSWYRIAEFNTSGLNVVTGNLTVAGNLGWHAGNDGSGSGLDADTVDGIQASSFLRSDAGDSWSGDIETTGTNRIRFGNAYQTDGNDGTIAAARFGTGLNIVGTQSTPGTGRQVRVWGSLITDGGNAYWHSANDGSGSGLDADLLDGIQGASLLRSDADDTFTGNLTTGPNNHITFGPNSTWGSSLRIGGNGRTATGTEMASIVTTDGNVHIDAAASNNGIYLNFYAGTAGVAFGNGASGSNAWVNTAGNMYRASLGNASNPYWHAANDGSGSGLDADLLDGIDSGSFVRSDANDTLSAQYSFTTTNNHAIRVGTIRGTAVGSQAGEFIQLYERVHIGSPNGWGQAATTGAPTYGLSVYGGANLATATGTVTIGGNTAWHAGNDGSGSGLDADLLDGYQLDGATSVATRIFNNKGQAHNTYTNFNTVMTPGPNYLQGGTNGPAAGQWYGFMLGLGSEYGTSTGSSGHYASQMYYPRAAQGNDPYLWFRDMESGAWGSWRKVYAGYADSAGNAGTLDGIDSSQFLRSDTSDTMSGELSVSGNIAINGSFGTGYPLAVSSSQRYMIGMRNTSADANYPWFFHETSSGQSALGIHFNAVGDKFLFREDGNAYFNGGVVYHSGNDGSGSGLDADLLDGDQGENYFRCKGDYPNTDMNTTVQGFWHVASNASNLPIAYYGHRWDWDHVKNGQWVFQMYSPTTGSADLWIRQKRNFVVQSWQKVWTSINDGAGSGLDADTVDGLQASQFLRSDASTGTSGTVLSVGPGSSNNIHVAIRHGAGSGDYGAVRFYQGGTNYQTIHGFSTAWQGGGLTNASTGAINLSGSSGVTFGPWNVPTGYVDNSGNAGFRGNVTAYAYSDIRLKHEIRPIFDDPLSKLMQLRGVRFDWDDEYVKSQHGDEDERWCPKHDVGMIAQEVKEVLPEITVEQDSGYLAIRYEKMIPLLVESIKELKAEVDDLKAQLKEK